MICPRCKKSDSGVIDSRKRGKPGDQRVRRRRECLRVTCKHRWTTYEIGTAYLERVERAEAELVALRKTIRGLNKLAGAIGRRKR